MSTTNFSIAHLSDPHLTRPAPVRLIQLCNKRCLGMLSWWRRRRHRHLPEVLAALVADLHAQRPDHTVITGDLTQVGLPVEFEQARDWLQALGDPRAVSLVPGNHDCYVRERWELSFARWRDYLASDEATTWSVADYPSLRTRGPVAIVGLNSAVPGYWIRAVGKLGNPQRERLAAVLRQLAQDDWFRLVLIHHAPVPGVDPWRKRLLDVRETRETLAGGRPHLVLHGHDHHTRWSTIASGGEQIPVIAVPSASCSLAEPGRRAAYHIYHLSRHQGRWRAEVEVRALVDGSVRCLERRQLALPAYR